MDVVVSHWSANAAALAAYAVIAAVHLLGVRGAIAGAATPDGRRAGRVREAVVFQAGLLLVLLALVSPLAYWSRLYLWPRAVQDLLLAIAGPALIVMGAPWLPLARGLAAARRQSAAGSGAASAGAAAPGAAARERPSRGWLTVPVGVTAGYNVAWIGWHLPFLYDEALRQPLVYAAEVICFLGGGILLWRQLIGSWPHTPAFAPLYRVMLVAGTMASGAVLGMTLAFGSAVVYPAYLTPLHLHPFSVVSDQQAGGGILWLLSLPPLLIAGVALLIRWLNDEEAEAVATGLDRLAGPSPRPVWPSRPGLR